VGYPLLLSELFDVGCNFNFGNEMAGCVACVAGSAISIIGVMASVQRCAPCIEKPLPLFAGPARQACKSATSTLHGACSAACSALGRVAYHRRFRISMCGKTKPSIIEQASTGRVHMSPLLVPLGPPSSFLCPSFSRACAAAGRHLELSNRVKALLFPLQTSHPWGCSAKL